MLGPESTATGLPVTSVDSRRPVAGSRPFVRTRIGHLPGSAATVSPNAALGTAITARFASPTGAAAIVDAETPWRSTWVRYRGLWPVAAIAAAWSGSRQARVTSWPWSRRTTENAVPHEPPP